MQGRGSRVEGPPSGRKVIRNSLASYCCACVGCRSQRVIAPKKDRALLSVSMRWLRPMQVGRFQRETIGAPFRKGDFRLRKNLCAGGNDALFRGSLQISWLDFFEVRVAGCRERVFLEMK